MGEARRRRDLGIEPEPRLAKPAPVRRRSSNEIDEALIGIIAMAISGRRGYMRFK